MAKRTATVELELQPYIDSAPLTNKDLYSRSTSSDEITVNTWRKTWIDNTKANHKKFGAFKDKSMAPLYEKYKHKPCIVAGSGPSLKLNVDLLKYRDGIPLVSCLHNFHIMEDNDAAPEYYVSLDAGEVTIEEVSEGGNRSADEYWALTKDRTLLAFMGTSPKLLEKWQGEIMFYACPVPDQEFTKFVEELEVFGQYVSTGGNVLGASTYIAKGYLGCNPIVWIGADFSFGYDSKFHAWDSKYDKDIGQTLKHPDIYGIPVKTWASYFNFKCWFDQVAQTVPGIWMNASERGILGSYLGGNIRAIKQMALADVLAQYKMSSELKVQALTPWELDKRILF